MIDSDRNCAEIKRKGEFLESKVGEIVSCR